MSDEAKKKPDEKEPGSEYTRREFLYLAGGAGLTPILQQRKVIVRPGEQKKVSAQVGAMPFIISVLRPDDLLNLEFEFINLKVAKGTPPKLVRQNADSPAYMIVHFPPQSIAEEAFWEAAGEYKASAEGGKFRTFPLPSNSDVPRTPPVMSRISGRSRLAFRIPEDVEALPLTLESLLAWDLLELNLVPVALPPATRSGNTLSIKDAASASRTSSASAQAVKIQTGRTRLSRSQAAKIQAQFDKPQMVSIIPKIAAPGPYQTSIEMPYRLMISPDARAGWRHSVEAVTRDGRTELWHTRLAPLGRDGAPDETSDAALHVRGIWSPDFRADAEGDDPKHANTPFRMSLDPRDRHEIVHLTSNFFLKKPDQKPLVPEPVDVKRLMLTSLGAWLESQGNWEPPAPLSVQEWRHRATMARDHFVRVVYKGYLLPFGNQASLVKVTERKFYKREDGQQIAYLFQRMFIVVRKPEKTVPVPYQANDGRELPFRQVRITTLVTPSLNKPEASAVGSYGQSAFWPRVGSGDFPFHVVARDWEGKSAEFEIPMLFVGNDCAYNIDKMKDVVAGYNGASPAGRRKASLQGQKIAFAAAGAKGDTSLEAQSVSFGVKSAEGGPSKETFELADQPMCFPLMEEAAAFIPALKGMAGLDATRLAYPDSYVQNGLGGANKGEVFARIIAPPAMSFASNKGDKSGGIATPSFAVAALSRVLGPIGSASADAADADASLADALGGRFDPMKIFDGSAKLLGGILLKDIIGTVADFRGATDKALRIKTETIEENGTPVAVKTIMSWKPDLHDASIFIASRNGTAAALVIEATQIAYLNGQAATCDVRGELTDFTLDLLKGVASFVRVMFSRFTYTAKSGQKSDVTPEFAGLEFLGPLKFVKDLLDKIQMPGGDFGKPIIDISSSGATLGYTFGLPTIAFGVFSLQNIKLTVAITLPFNGDPVSLRFAFNERNNPFLLTVSMFGGGGFFGIVLTAEKIKLIEGSMEFGGSFALSIGVASGSLTLMAGIYFKYEESLVTVSGYVRCNGSVDVLGIISISAEFYLSLTYDEGKNSVYGQASLTVKVEVLFFSAKVTLTVEREFAHSPAPLFADLMDQSHWLSYCEAFA